MTSLRGWQRTEEGRGRGEDMGGGGGTGRGEGRDEECWAGRYEGWEREGGGRDAKTNERPPPLVVLVVSRVGGELAAGKAGNGGGSRRHMYREEQTMKRERGNVYQDCCDTRSSGYHTTLATTPHTTTRCTVLEYTAAHTYTHIYTQRYKYTYTPHCHTCNNVNIKQQNSITCFKSMNVCVMLYEPNSARR